MKWILKQLKALWAWILKQLKSFWAWICRLAVAFWNWLLSRSQERWFYLCLGMFLTAFGAIVFNYIWWLAVVVFIGFAIEFVRNWVSKEYRWKDFFSLIIGGAIIFALQLIP